MAFSDPEDEEREGESVNSLNEPETKKQTEEWGVCGVCRAALNSSAAPKLLPCLHPVCRACFGKSSEDGNTGECPTCGQPFSLSEVSDCYMFEDTAPKCGGCEESEVSGWCVHCEEALCSECVQAHQRVKLTRNHLVIPEEPPSGFMSGMRCSSHRQELHKFFCVTCDELTCKDCQLMNHRGHSFLLLEEALVSQKGHLQKLMHIIREKRVIVNASLMDLESRLNNVMECKAAAKTKLAKLVTSLQMLFIVRGRQLLKEVEDLYDEEHTNLMKMKTTLKGLENSQAYITSFIQKILSTKGQCILLHKKQILNRAEGLLSQKTSLYETTLHPSIHINRNVYEIIKTFGSVKSDRIPYSVSETTTNNHTPNDTTTDDSSLARINNLSGATTQLSTNVESKTVLDQPPSSPVSASLNAARLCSKAASVSHAGASSVSPLDASVQTPQSSQTAESVPVPGTPVFPQPVLSYSVCPQLPQSKKDSRSLSHPQTQTMFSMQGQPILNSIVDLQPSRSIAKSGIAQPVPQTANIPVSAPLQNFTASLPHHSALHYKCTSLSSSQSCVTNNTAVVQSPSIILHPAGSVGHQSTSTVVQSAQSVQSNTLHSGHVQQSFSASQLVSVQTAPNQALDCTLLAASTQPLPVYQNPSVPQTVFFQHPLLFTLLQNPQNNPKHQYAPVPTVNQTPVLTCAPQPSLLFTAPPSVPAAAVTVSCNSQNVPNAATSGKSLHPVPNKKACSSVSVDPKITDLPGSSNEDLASTVSNKPPLSSTETPPSTSSNQGQHECSAQPPQKPQVELPVQAPADSVYERNISIHNKASPASEEPDDSLPTSTVSETETKDFTAGQEQCPASHTLPDRICSSPARKNPPDKNVVSQPKSQLNSALTMLPSEKASTSKHWSTGLPTSLRQILEQKDASASKVDGQEIITDFEPVEEDEEEINEWEFELPEACNESLQWPFSISTSEPNLQIVSFGQADDTLPQECLEEQAIQRRLRTTSQSSIADGYQPDNLQNCAVCQSSGVQMICAECGRGFHSSCHVPPVLCRPVQMWICTLCQDVFDDSDPFSQDRLKEPYLLSLQDQRRCEQLLLTVMCDEHSYLLYRATMRTAGCVEFDFIRRRLLGKQTPPYRSAAELVSDLWGLFDSLSGNTKKRDLVIKLQNSFRERLDASFGKSLHASLLRPLSSEQKGAPEAKLDKEKAKTTLKKMREFLAENSTLYPKRPRTERSGESPEN